MALYGVYGSHTPESCPVNNKKIAEVLADFSNADPASVAGGYKINQVLGQYHYALEHTFLDSITEIKRVPGVDLREEE